jgi:type VI secretion system protein ImpJ
MKQLSRVVWTEGMHLAQHHFQAQNRYFEDSVDFALSQLFFAAYGVAGCELDREALRNGTVALLHARGVMPDGLAFDIPSSDAPPPPLLIGDLFSPTRDNHLVLLTIPRFSQGRASVTQNGDGRGAASATPRTRFVAAPRMVSDDMTGRDERSVSLGQKNFRLTLDLEPGAPSDDVALLPIARVRRDGSGHFIYDPEYIAPCLHIGASERLVALLRRLVDVLDARAVAMGRGRPGAVSDFARTEIAGFWLLHTIHSSLPVLRHYLQIKQVRPEQLFVEMSRLAGALCTFALDADPRTLPAYDHDQLELAFGGLDRHIRSHLELVTQSGPTVIPLRETDPSLHTGLVADQRAFGNAQWILGVRASTSSLEIATRIPQLAKVCASKFTLELVRRGFPGMGIAHMPAPPSSIAPRDDTQYFLITRAGPCWDTLSTTGEIGVYVPDILANAQLELIIAV